MDEMEFTEAESNMHDLVLTLISLVWRIGCRISTIPRRHCWPRRRLRRGSSYRGGRV